MNKEKVISALECCAAKKCSVCPYVSVAFCVDQMMQEAVDELRNSEVDNMAYGSLDTEKDNEQLRAEREKMLAEIDYQRRQLDEVLQENKLLQAQMHIVHLIFGRRTGNE